MEEEKQKDEEISPEPPNTEGDSQEVQKNEPEPVEAPVEAKPEPSAEEVEEKVGEEAPAPVEAEEKAGEKAEEEVKEGSDEKEEEKAEEKAAVPGDRKWYVIQALTGQEDRVKQAIELTIESKALKDKVFQVLVPTEEIVEIKGGKRVVKVKKMFPGYVFLEMILDEESWYLIRETAGVARFIGTKIKPTPVSEKEMQRVLKQLGKEERLEITFEKGEGVRVISGPFRGYTGTVDEVNAEKGKLKVLINIFGRDTPVEVNFEHAQKIV
ncbi:transcription termination/antitermination protein NusG [Candidatus Margulisiibacteriota bacterium]